MLYHAVKLFFNILKAEKQKEIILLVGYLLLQIGALITEKRILLCTLVSCKNTSGIFKDSLIPRGHLQVNLFIRKFNNNKKTIPSYISLVLLIPDGNPSYT